MAIDSIDDADLDVDDFAPRLSFFFVARTTLLEEIAKFRAARRIWARVMRDEFRAKNPKSQMLRFHTQTAGVQLTTQQPEVNVHARVDQLIGHHDNRLARIQEAVQCQLTRQPVASGTQHVVARDLPRSETADSEERRGFKASAVAAPSHSHAAS